MVKRALLALFGLMTFSANAVVILQYHHVSETTPAATSVTPAQFREQMQFLANDGFKVIPLSQVVEAIKIPLHPILVRLFCSFRKLNVQKKVLLTIITRRF